MSRAHFYVGYRNYDNHKYSKHLFKSAETPTGETHGDLYFAVLGPFRTKLGAVCDILYADNGNPHIQCVADAERIAKQYEAELKAHPLYKARV